MWAKVEGVLEFLAHWLGGTTKAELSKVMNFTPRRLTELIDEGATRRGSAAAVYDGNEKRWLSEAETEDLHGVKTADDVVNILLAEKIISQTEDPRFPCPVVDTSSFRPKPHPDVFRIMSGACARRRPTWVSYRTPYGDPHWYSNAPVGSVASVEFSPHTIVRTIRGIHFRGYNRGGLPEPGKNKWGFFDLPAANIIDVELRDADEYISGTNDEEWNEKVKVTFKIRSEVPEDVRQIVRTEHVGISNNDRLTIGPFQKCLLPYIKAEYFERPYEGYDGRVWEAA